MSHAKPSGYWKCRVCGNVCEGEKLVQDPMSTALKWTCSNYFCGGVVDNLDPKYIVAVLNKNDTYPYIEFSLLKSKIEEIYQENKTGYGWDAWSALSLWLTQYEQATQTKISRAAELVEAYINSLPWTEDTPDIHKTLVAGNIRSFYQWAKKHLAIERTNKETE